MADYWARRETSAAAERAVALMLGQSQYYFRLAVLLAEQDPARSNAALRRAVALNPADADSWIELGLRSEAGGDYAAAERCLLRAAEENQQYLPRWTLANYYYRRNDGARFWHWAKSAAAMVYGDPAPLFDLCARAAENGDLAERLELRSPDQRAGYLAYLLGRSETGRVAASAQSVMKGGRPSDVPLLEAACDRLVEDRQVEGALLIWNGLIAAHREPFAALSPDGGPVLTNGAFAISPTSRGFDWRLASIEGVSAAREEAVAGLRLTFSGGQPESCEPLAQFVPVLENGAYELRFAYRTSGIPAGEGPRWQVTGCSGGGAIAESAALSSQDIAPGRLAFVSPPGCRLIRLRLACQRTPGTTRIEGYIVLRDVRIERLTGH